MNTTPEGSGADAQNNRHEAGHQIFSWIRSTGLHRPDDAWVGGIFAALAHKLRWDTALVRGLGIVAFIIFTSPALLFYGLGWLFLPDARGRIHAQEAVRGSYPSGLWGAAIVTFLGAVNVFTPNVVGPFAILLNLVIIGVVAWVIWLMISNHRSGAERSADPKAPSSDPQPPGGSTAEESGQGESAPRSDGKPAWYPKAGPEPEPEQTLSAAVGPAAALKVPEPEEDPVERDARRRRRMVTFGLLLLALPAVGAAAWFATQVGLATTSAVLLGLAAVVILLALMNLTAALRGNRGRNGLLGMFTALMVLVFLMAPAVGGSNHVLGNYSTSESQVNTAFANTTVDLRHLTFQEDDVVELTDRDGGDGMLPTQNFHTSVVLNSAFGNATVIVPDETYVEVEPNSFLANLSIHTVDGRQDQSGISTTRLGAGPPDAEGAVELNLNNAFGNVTVYDETTYNREELGIFDDADSRTHMEENR